jgi:hypothetical protein
MMEVISNMRNAILVALLLIPTIAAADSITTGKLDFDCSRCDTRPAHGSFSYDNTLGKFLTATFTWNGMPFAFDIDPAVGSRNQPEIFADLTAGLFPLRFSLLCGASNPFYCGDPSDSFFIDGNGGFLAFADQGDVQPLFANDFATGTVTAFALHDPAVSTPEPSFWLLLVAGIGLLWMGLLRYPPKQPSLSQPGTL